MIIVGGRLRLEPIDVTAGQALLLTKSGEDWPSDALKVILPLYLERLEIDHEELGYGPWVIKHRFDDYVIGDIGFKGKPDHNGKIEVGYQIIKKHRNKGFAKEALALLCDWAFQQNVNFITASCYKVNTASRKVLAYNDFIQLGEEKDVLQYVKHNNKKTGSHETACE